MDDVFNMLTNQISLTERQTDCLYYLVLGMTIKQIGETMGLSARTVEHYLEAVKSKLQCKTRVDLISKALKMRNIKERLSAN